MRSLEFRLTTQTFAFVAVLGGILFGCARTFDFWRAWFFCALNFLCVSGIGAWLLVRDRALLERRLKAGGDGEPTRRQKALQSLSGFSFVCIFVVAGVDRHHGWCTVPALVSIGADLLVVGAFYAVFLVFRANTFTSSIVEVEATQRLISTGPYSVVRHPMYAAASLMIAAIPIALGSSCALVPAVAVIALIVFRLLDEERILARDLEGYRQYMQTTRYRLIPKIW